MAKTAESYKDIFDYTHVVKVKTMPSSISLSYVDLMKLIEKFPVEDEEDDSVIKYKELTPIQLQMLSVNSFNVTILGEVPVQEIGQEKTYVSLDTDDVFKSNAAVNSITIEEIQTVKSYSFYNISAIDITFKPDVTEKKNLYKRGDTLNIGIVIEAIENDGKSKFYSLLYEFVYFPDKDSMIMTEDEDDANNVLWEGYNPEDGLISDISVSRDDGWDCAFINTMTFGYIRDQVEASGGQPVRLARGLLRIHVDPRYAYDLTINYTLNGIPRQLVYSPKYADVPDQTYSRIKMMNDPDVSYALLRTNPKLTGNVKVVVDSNDNIYLDTFKITRALAQKKYRHVKVSSTDYYGQNLMNSFSSIPTTDFYKIEDKCCNLFTTVQTYHDEYYDMYRMGAKTNDDEMYSENYSVFAPICLKSYTPDFFVVFKIDKTKTKDNIPLYVEDEMTDEEKIKYFIKYGTVVKSYDMRPGSKLGDYVKTIVDKSSKWVGDIYESYDTKNFNKTIGISVEKGVVTSLYESVYPKEKVNNQVALNEYYTSGFERNHLVSKNIINFEFMFDDPEAKLFSINTYFGLYIKVNTSGDDYSCIKSVKIEDKISNSFDTEINTFGPEVTNIRSTFSTTPLIYGLSTPTSFIRLNTNIYSSEEVAKYDRKPYKNILSTKIVKIENCSFLTFGIDDLLSRADHIKIIFPSEHLIYEIIFSNISHEYYPNTTNNLSEVITNIHHHASDKELVMKRISVLLDVYKDKDKNDDVTKNTPENRAQTTTYVFDALNALAEKEHLKVYRINDNTIGLSSPHKEVIFERICAVSGFDVTQNDYIQTTKDEEKTIAFFEKIYPEKTILTSENVESIQYLGPIDFEIAGPRMAYIINFANINQSEKFLYYGEIFDKKIFNNKTILYKSNENYTIYNDIELKYYTTENNEITTKNYYVSYLPYFKEDNRYIFNVQSPTLSVNNLLLYNAYPLNDGICSIFNIKDFDFDVLDHDTTIFRDGTKHVIGTLGEYAEVTPFISEDANTAANSGAVEYNKIFFTPIPESFDRNFDSLYSNTYGNYLNTVLHENGDEVTVLLKPLVGNENNEPINIFHVTHDYYNRLLKIRINEFGEREYELQDKIPADDPEYSYDIVRLSAPLRNTSEEFFYDYIDKYRNYSNTPDDYNSDEPYNYETMATFDRQLKQYYVENHRTFDIPLVSPYSCKWKSIGTDARGENMRLMYDFNKFTNIDPGNAKSSNRSYYISGPDTFSSYLGFLQFTDKYSSGNIFKKYFRNSLSEIIPTGKEIGTTLKDSLLTSNVTFNDILYDDVDFDNKFSVTYLSGDNTLEFISSGIKMRIKSTNDNAINLNNYQGYSAIIVSFPIINENYSRPTELIIDEIYKEIIVIWYQNVNTLECGKTKNIEGAIVNKLDVEDDENAVLYLSKFNIQFSFNDITSGYVTPINDQSSVLIGKIPDNANLGKNNVKLCNEWGALAFLSVGSVDDVYCKYNNLMFTGEIKTDYPVSKSYSKTVDLNENTTIKDISATSAYYLPENHISICDPLLWSGNKIFHHATPDVLDSEINNYKDCTQVMYVTDTSTYIVNSIGGYEQFETDLKRCSVYIKTSEGKKDYTNLTGIIEMTLVNPIEYGDASVGIEKAEEKESSFKGYVHSTYAEPVMKDMLKFDYSNDDINDIFKLSFSGGNIFVNNIKTINQLWINKYTENSNYAINVKDKDVRDATLKLSTDVIYNKSIMESAWDKNLYRKYFLTSEEDDNNESYEYVDGYVTGYEHKNFINSRGIQLTNFENKVKAEQSFDIVAWKNTSISYNKGYIRLDISDSIIYKLLNDINYMSAWNYLKLSSNNYKINYIKKTILPLININNKTRLVLRRSIDPKDKFSFIQEFTEENTVDILNYKNTLTYENGKYYMYIYPEENYTYYAKMIIDL